MRQFLNLIGAAALGLSLCHGFPEKRRKSLKPYKIFDNPSHLEAITGLDAVFLPTPSPLKANSPNLEIITDWAGDRLSPAGRKVNTDDKNSYYFGDDINLTENYTEAKSPSAQTIFVTPTPARLSSPDQKNPRKYLKPVGPPSGDTELVTPRTLQSLYKSDFNNKTFKLSLKFPNTSANYFYQSDLYNKSLDQLFSSPQLTPETSHEYPLRLIVSQSGGGEEGLDIADHTANDILTPAFSYDELQYSGKPQSLFKLKHIEIHTRDVDKDITFSPGYLSGWIRIL